MVRRIVANRGNVSRLSKGDTVRVNMPGIAEDMRQGTLPEAPGVQVARVRFGDGQERLIPVKRLVKVS